jgi:hypothetical protein
VAEVRELVERRESFDRVGGQRVVVAPGDLEECVGANGALEMYVQLDLRIRGHRRR